MLKQIVCAASVALATIAAPLPLRAPQIGVIRDAAHNLRPVYGFSGNLITGAPLPIKDVLAASFSDDAGIVLTPGAVKLVTVNGEERGSYPTKEVQPVLSITGPADTAVAWLPSERKLVRWNGNAFAELPVSASDVPGQVVGLAMKEADSIDLFIENQANVVENLRVALTGGGVNRIRTYTGAGGQAVAAGQSVVFPSADGLQVASGICPVESIALPDSHVTLEKASPNWVHVTSPARHGDWMLHIDRSHPAISELPAVQPLRMASGAGAQ
jgi:hypothetical protein